LRISPNPSVGVSTIETKLINSMLLWIIKIIPKLAGETPNRELNSS